jgi:hypothetical protein
MEHTLLDWVALFILIFVILTVIYGVIYIHDIPYNIAKKRGHPQAEAIHTAGWVSLFLLHTIWPFLWIWATLWHPEKGWNLKLESEKKASDEAMHVLEERIAKLEAALQTKEV